MLTLVTFHASRRTHDAVLIVNAHRIAALLCTCCRGCVLLLCVEVENGCDDCRQQYCSQNPATAIRHTNAPI
jgi:hypothetical protein